MRRRASSLRKKQTKNFDTNDTSDMPRISPNIVIIGLLTIITCWITYVSLSRKGSTPKKEMKTVSSSNFHNIEKSQTNIINSSIQLNMDAGQVQSELKYLKCENNFGIEKNLPEILLLHGAAFKKENWKESGILESLCGVDTGVSRFSSVVAVDLSVRSTGLQLKLAIDSLYEANILNVKPLVLVSPSASGKGVLELSDVGIALNSILLSWIPVACPSIMKKKEETLKKFLKEGTPILAVYGSRDKMGEKVTERLVKFASAEKKMIDGRHPCYLDSPNNFVEAIFDFGKKRNIW